MECGKDIEEIHANERKHELWLSFLFDMLYLFQDKVRYDDRLPRLIKVKFYCTVFKNKELGNRVR